MLELIYVKSKRKILELINVQNYSFGHGHGNKVFVVDAVR